jgi:glycine/D-amino acid oxidase-like deaminating enzyme
MDLRSEYPYWLLKEGIIRSYPSLDKDIRSDIAIIGAGITGALMAYHLGKEGFSVTIVDRRHVGMGSTAATTGLLQYEIDTPLKRLISLVGEKHAVRSYELCIESIEKIGNLVNVVSNNDEVDFEYKPSFQYASYLSHIKDLKEEFNLRKKYRLSTVDWLEEGDIKNKFGFRSSAGILSSDAARINAYKFTHTLLIYCINHFNAKVFDSTEVVKTKIGKSGCELLTNTDRKIHASHLVICAGYESEIYLNKKVEIRKSTYAIVSEPIPGRKFWYNNALIWETAVPYLYMCVTKDNRILVGGRDDDFYNPGKRDLNLKNKAQQLVKDFNKKFPDIPFRVDFKWAGTFCATKDGLPYIGLTHHKPNVFFALGFGGNGITFSLIASEIIRDMLTGKKNRDAGIFSFSRA